MSSTRAYDRYRSEEKVMEKVLFTTTFRLLRRDGACIRGYKKLARYLGGVRKYGLDTSINVLTVLKSNGITDALWCIYGTNQQDSKEEARFEDLVIKDGRVSLIQLSSTEQERMMKKYLKEE